MPTATFTVELKQDLELTPLEVEAFNQFLHQVSNEALAIAGIQEECGGEDASHPDYHLADWMDQVERLETRLGYWDWVYEQLLETGQIEDDT